MFKDNGDGTITDQSTGLVWQKDTEPGTYSWQDALEYCEGLDLAGHTDWRLPTIRELLSIVNYGRFDPAIDPVFGAVSSWYWSSSTDVGSPGLAWGVGFSGGCVLYNHKSIGHYVRAVRGGEVNA